MADAYLGEIRMFGGNFAPQDWLPCDGRLVNVSDYDALFALIGATYGGNGMTTFGLPDLRGRLPIGQGTGTGLTRRVLAQNGGSEAVVLTENAMPEHTHTANIVNTAGTLTNPQNGLWAATVNTASIPSVEVNQYIKTTEIVSPSKTGVMDPLAIGTSGDGGAHDNMMPYLPVSFIICVNGYFPTAG